MSHETSPALPYRIAVLCVLFDAQGRMLLLHRRKPPNSDLYSPIGGKLEQDLGESPAHCAKREIREEAGIDVDLADLHLTGMVSETAFEGQNHWLMLMYEVTRPVEVQLKHFDEGRLEWHPPEALSRLPIPQTDRDVIWPLFWKHRRAFFSVHIDCTQGTIKPEVHQPYPPQE